MDYAVAVKLIIKNLDVIILILKASIKPVIVDVYYLVAFNLVIRDKLDICLLTLLKVDGMSYVANI